MIIDFSGVTSLVFATNRDFSATGVGFCASGAATGVGREVVITGTIAIEEADSL